MTNKYQAPNANDAKADTSCSKRGGGEPDEITARVCAMQAGQRDKQGSYAGSTVTEVKHDGVWVRKEGSSEAGGQCLETWTVKELQS